MKIFTTFRPTNLGPVVGIGNFDGCHLGHRKIIQSVLELAADRGVPAIITFRNHTRLAGSGTGSRLLTTTRQRLDCFQGLGVAACWLIEFGRELSSLVPDEFIDQVLIRRLKIRGICVGEGFRFGADRTGTVELLRRRGSEAGFPVREIPTVHLGGQEVRSSRIREDVRNGRMTAAADLLGRPYCLTGRVISGWGKGRGLGYPTANFIPRQLLPAFGVYAARIEVGSTLAGGIFYVGRRPTFASPAFSPPVAEAHIFDWSGRLGGRRIKVYLLKKLREDIKFPNERLLVARMKDDERQARSLLS